MSIFKDHIDAMSPYLPPLEGRDPESFDLLDFNERTAPVSRLIVADIVEWLHAGRLQMYPSYTDITQKIADVAAVAPENLMITNGSDQGIDLVFRAACDAGDEVIIPAPSFAMYTQCAQVQAAKIHAPHYSLGSGFPLQEVLDLINARTRVIVIANPNNPCATAVDRQTIVNIARTAAEKAPRAVVLVDECYFEYLGVSVVDLVDQWPNLVVTRTFSKTWGFPSLRIGYVVACKNNIDALLKVRGPYDVNQVAVVAIESALRHRETIHDYVAEVMQKSKSLFESFLRKNNIVFWPSSANFIWVFFDEPQSVEQSLREAGILVRPKQDAQGRMGLRITLGTFTQTQRLIAVLQESLSCQNR